ETGIDVQVGGLSINLANGFLYLKDLEVKNPPGFLLENLATVGRVTVEVDISSMFRQKPIRINHIEEENVWLNEVRNKACNIDVDYLQSEHSPPAGPSKGIGLPAPDHAPDSVPPAPSSGPTSVQTKPLPEVLIKTMQCNARVRYLDLKLNQLDLALA